MGKRVYIFSTLSNDQLYTEYAKGGGDVPVIGKQLLIRGGAGVANDRLITPLGVSTDVDEADVEWLKTIPAFADHLNRGHLSIQPKPYEPEKVVPDLERDPSSPLTPGDYAAAGDNDVKAPSVGAVTSKK